MEMAKEGPNHKLLKGSPPYSSSSRFRSSIFGFWITFDLASRSPFEIFAIGGAVDELQVWARKGHTVSEAHTLAQQIWEFIFLFSSTLDIASRSPFGIFVVGGAADELQVKARKGHTVSETRAQQI